MTDFTAPRWLRNAHLQTLGAALPAFAPPRSHARMVLDDLRIPIGEGFCLHAKAWWGNARRPLAVILHGIGGSSESSYVARAAVALHRAGYHAVRVDLRGAGASVPDVPSLYHAGLSADVAPIVSHFEKDARVDGVVIVGFSGGGGMALKAAGEWGANAPPSVRAVVSVSAPLDYTLVAPWMDTLARLPYRFHVLRGLSRGARAFATHHPERAHYRASDVRRMSSFRHYDGSVIAPMHGFPNVDAYYEAAGAGPWLSKIDLPTLVLHADDDPMVPGFTVREWLKTASPAVEVAVSTHGGHIGWVAGFDEASWIHGWTMKRAIAFLDRTLSSS